MGNEVFYIVYLKSTPMLKVLFYAPEVEFWAESEGQGELQNRFRKTNRWNSYPILGIEPVDLPYDDIVIG